MRQTLACVNKSDGNANPTGGHVSGVGIDIDWQDGPLGNPPDMERQNGAFVEGVIEAAIQRLQYFQTSKFVCRENAIAITKLEEALHWLDARTSKRGVAGVEGTHQI